MSRSRGGSRVEAVETRDGGRVDSRDCAVMSASTCEPGVGKFVFGGHANHNDDAFYGWDGDQTTKTSKPMLQNNVYDPNYNATRLCTYRTKRHGSEINSKALMFHTA